MSTVPAAFYGAWYKLEKQLLGLAFEADYAQDDYIMEAIVTEFRENTKEMLKVLGFDTKDVTLTLTLTQIDEFEKKKNEEVNEKLTAAKK